MGSGYSESLAEVIWFRNVDNTDSNCRYNQAEASTGVGRLVPSSVRNLAANTRLKKVPLSYNHLV